MKQELNVAELKKAMAPLSLLQERLLWTLSRSIDSEIVETQLFRSKIADLESSLHREGDLTHLADVFNDLLGKTFKYRMGSSTIETCWFVSVGYDENDEEIEFSFGKVRPCIEALSKFELKEVERWKTRF